MEVNRQGGGEIVLWDVGVPGKLIRAEDFCKEVVGYIGGDGTRPGRRRMTSPVQSIVTGAI